MFFPLEIPIIVTVRYVNSSVLYFTCGLMRVRAGPGLLRRRCMDDDGDALCARR
jgi:hypothetical protein